VRDSRFMVWFWRSLPAVAGISGGEADGFCAVCLAGGGAVVQNMAALDLSGQPYS